MMTKLIHIILAFLFPIHCVGCGQAETILCFACEQKIIFTNQEADNINCLFSYKDKLVKKLLWYFKYRDLAEAGKVFVPYLKDRLLAIISDNLVIQSYLDSNKIILIPVPSSRKRQWQKKKNHIAELATAIARDTDYLDYRPELIIKTRHTKTQVSCRNRAERLVNLKNAFHLTNPSAVKNKICVIIDDVMTTGATMNELRKVLLAGGAQTVLGLTIAHS